MLYLSNGDCVMQDEGEWVVLTKNGIRAPVAKRPNCALLLLEQDPLTTIEHLPGFPFQLVVDYAQSSGSPRYMAQADEWQGWIGSEKSTH